MITPITKIDIPDCIGLLTKNIDVGSMVDYPVNEFYGDLRTSFIVGSKSTLTFYKYTEGNEFIGLMGYGTTGFDDHISSIIWVLVDPAYHNKGIGKMLVNRILDEVNSKIILISTDKILFFGKFGFEPIRDIDGVYTLMLLELKNRKFF